MDDRGLTLRISNCGEAAAAASMATLLGRPRVANVEIAVAGLDPATASDLGGRIRALFNDCGCAWGEVALLCAVVVFVLGPHTVGWPAQVGWGVGIALAVGAAVGGKLLGLIWSRRKLRNLLQRLAAAPSLDRRG